MMEGHGQILILPKESGPIMILTNISKRKFGQLMVKGNEDYPITLTFDDPTFRVIITLATNYQLDLTKSDFNELIGYDKKIIKDETNIGVRVPNLTQDTDVLKYSL